MSKTVLQILVLLACAAPAIAADGFFGKWEATLETPRGTNDITIELSGSTEAPSGTFTGPQGSSELEEVKIENDVLTFVRNVEFRGNAVRLDYECRVEGDALHVTMKTPRGEREFTAKRAK